jgi:DNA-binding NarL/FixJ family response regulator
VRYSGPDGDGTFAKPVTIVIIEAQTLFSPFLSHALSEMGFAVTATLATASPDAIGRNEPEAVLIDVDYLEMEPPLAVERLRSILPDAALCVYTRSLDTDVHAACVAAGANVIISKAELLPAIVENIYSAILSRRPVNRPSPHSDD